MLDLAGAEEDEDKEGGEPADRRPPAPLFHHRTGKPGDAARDGHNGKGGTCVDRQAMGIDNTQSSSLL